MFVEEWNGVSLAWASSLPDPDVCVLSDASGKWGCGAHWLPHWFVVQWMPRLQDKSIQVKELFPIVVSAATFGRLWKGKVVRFTVDNEAVVEVLKSGYSREPHLMHMLWVLVFLACHFQFWWSAKHIAGVENILADAISRIFSCHRDTPNPQLLLMSQCCWWIFSLRP